MVRAVEQVDAEEATNWAPSSHRVRRLAVEDENAAGVEW
jgi:hypothetical protein